MWTTRNSCTQVDCSSVHVMAAARVLRVQQLLGFERIEHLAAGANGTSCRDSDVHWNAITILVPDPGCDLECACIKLLNFIGVALCNETASWQHTQTKIMSNKCMCSNLAAVGCFAGSLRPCNQNKVSAANPPCYSLIQHAVVHSQAAERPADQLCWGPTSIVHEC